NWEGATPLYPAQFVFENVEQAVQLVRQFGTEDHFTRLADQNRAYARERFDTTVIVRQIEALLDGAGIPELGTIDRGVPAHPSQEGAGTAPTVRAGASH
ncbi:MAG TPA: hypothetical protein PLQ89_21675, partial [Phycisphaerae bacterium]|nr:hypothetical protein [Phycisphaerae bacterium]HPP29213.1 hypothetical protein [Phycisphaerae bacterium]HPU28616.1 hypothetical protein [Phycisphaerae bacterium]